MAEFTEQKVTVVNVEAPYFKPQLVGVHFLDDTIPHGILSAMGVADDDLEKWTIYGASPGPEFEPKDTDIVIDVAQIAERAEGRYLDDFRKAAAHVILGDMLYTVACYDLDDEAFQGRLSAREAAVCGFIGSLLIDNTVTDLGAIKFAVLPTMLGGLVSLVPSRRRLIKRKTREMVNNLNTSHPGLARELYDTVLPRYILPE